MKHEKIVLLFDKVERALDKALMTMNHQDIVLTQVRGDLDCIMQQALHGTKN